MTGLIHIFGPGAEGIREAGEAARLSNKCFVRSAAQLAPYRPDGCPTGHILTAWEAFDTFGIEVLEEATEYGAAILKKCTQNSVGQALKSRRESISLTPTHVARAALVSEAEINDAEHSMSEVAMDKLSRIALALGMDERLLAFEAHDPGDKLAVRLRILQGNSHTKPISPGTALLFAEAASIIRIHHRLQNWLRIVGEINRFERENNYGSPNKPAWSVGYDLAEKARNVLGLGPDPISSMRELVEERLGIPVVQAPLPGNPEIAGVTVATTDKDGNDIRGIVLNTEGANNNVWVRRTTLAYELGHLLYDPVEKIENLRIDPYEEGETDPQDTNNKDFVEQRANAFAVAFLAPNEAVRNVATLPLSVDSVAETMRKFGIGRIAARYHIRNCYYGQYDVPNIDAAAETPSDEQTVAENFTVDYFPLPDTSDQRRGRFAYLVAKCCRAGLISEHTAALYLQCAADELTEQLEPLIGLYE